MEISGETPMVISVGREEMMGHGVTIVKGLATPMKTARNYTKVTKLEATEVR